MTAAEYVAAVATRSRMKRGDARLGRRLRGGATGAAVAVPDVTER